MFPHLKQVAVSTHSHLFLDRRDISNNFIVSKNLNNVHLRQVNTMTDLHELQFNLLGNSLESLFLPSAIIVVEGKTDKPFIEKAVNFTYPDKRILVIEAQGDVKRVFNSVCQSMGDIHKSPFRDRTFVILDSIHTTGTKDILVRMEAKADNVVIWERNGIEYVYPTDILCQIYSCSPTGLSNLQITDDEVSLNGIAKRKAALCVEVVAAMSAAACEFPVEMRDKLLIPLGRSIGEVASEVSPDTVAAE